MVLPASSPDVLYPERGQGKLKSRSPASPAFPLLGDTSNGCLAPRPQLASLEPQP